jgi:hypothetical protein
MKYDVFFGKKRIDTIEAEDSEDALDQASDLIVVETRPRVFYDNLQIYADDNNDDAQVTTIVCQNGECERCVLDECAHDCHKNGAKKRRRKQQKLSQ